MNSPKLMFAAVVAIVLLILASMSLFVVKENETALLLRLGKIVDSDFKPGLHVKMPVIQTVQRFDKRLQTLDAKPEHFLTSEKKFVVVDSYIKWRIDDTAQYYRSTRGDMMTTSRLLGERINAALRDEFGKRTISEVVSGERTQIMDELTRRADESSSDLGVEIVDVRIKRIDFPPEISNRVYERMRTERERVARELRAQGAEAAERIRAEADRQKTEILAKAYRESEEIRGKGDAEAAGIYARAFATDAGFYSFWRSLKAYRKVFATGSNMMVLDPDSSFFRYFKGSAGQ
ncbi:protease modulator HflC [Thiolapillus brandeum]|uniref:Protein HflC n=1 Tax=Thiolapillus brandeum TaxID=1076588 RepID=A0A7U6GJZ9_9GAMM|nr:protease modulator HflC [Thiolapillus brandeum]BAO45005.1 membrane protease subunit HflC [Thiolapillus brandeum]